MTFTSKHLLAIAALSCVARAASAAIITHDVQPGGPLGDLSLSLNTSAQAVAFLNATGSYVDPIGATGIDSTVNPRFKYTSLTLRNLVLSSFSYDDVSGQLLSAQAQGGVLITTDDGLFGVLNSALRIENLRIDFASSTVLADVQGTVGLSSPPGETENVALWQFDGAIGTFDGTNNLQLHIPTLAFTTQGLDVLSRTIAPLPDHQDALRKVTSFGSVSLVPEPGTQAMMVGGLLGLAGLVGSRRRDRASL